jgi:hypothetical protein
MLAQAARRRGHAARPGAKAPGAQLGHAALARRQARRCGSIVGHLPLSIRCDPGSGVERQASAKSPRSADC